MGLHSTIGPDRVADRHRSSRLLPCVPDCRTSEPNLELGGTGSAPLLVINELALKLLGQISSHECKYIAVVVSVEVCSAGLHRALSDS